MPGLSCSGASTANQAKSQPHGRVFMMETEEWHKCVSFWLEHNTRGSFLEKRGDSGKNEAALGHSPVRHLCTLSQCVIHGDWRAALTHVLVPREGHAKVTRLTRPQKLQSAFAEERAGWDLNDWTRESVSPGTWEIHKLKAGLSFLQRNWTERMKSEGRNRETRGGSGQSLSALSVGSTSRFHTSVQKHHLDVQHMQKSCTLRRYKAVWTLTWRLECKNELRSQLTQEMLFTFFYGRHRHD